MKKFFITIVLFCFCSITFSKDYTFVVGEDLGTPLKTIVPGEWNHPWIDECSSIIYEVKLTGENSGYFRLRLVGRMSIEFTYNVKIGDKFYMDGNVSYYAMLPYKGTETLGELDQIWTVKDIQDNLITFEEQ